MTKLILQIQQYSARPAVLVLTFHLLSVAVGGLIILAVGMSDIITAGLAILTELAAIGTLRLTLDRFDPVYEITPTVPTSYELSQQKIGLDMMQAISDLIDSGGQFDQRLNVRNLVQICDDPALIRTAWTVLDSYNNKGGHHEFDQSF